MPRDEELRSILILGAGANVGDAISSRKVQSLQELFG